MAPSDFARPKEGFRFSFGGIKTNARPDALPPNKYPLAINVREYESGTLRSRPGLAQLFQAAGGNKWFTDLRAYTALGTDDLPRILARNADDTIWLDNSTQVGSLAGGGASLGASMIPFRPNQSPNPYMYIANGSDYQKFSAPDASNNVIQKKVGIAEPQSAPQAAPVAQRFSELLAPSGAWITGGTASAWSSGSRSADNIIIALPDPAQATNPTRWSIRGDPVVQFQRGEVLYFNGTPAFVAIVEDVVAPLAVALTVQGIYYFNGTTGRCVIVPQGVSVPQNIKESGDIAGVVPESAQLIATFRRGALIQVGTEICYVWSVSTGPDNAICLETSTVNPHNSGEALTGIPTVIVNGVPSSPSIDPATTCLAPGTPIVGDQGNVETFTVGAGIGTLTMGAPGGSTGVIAHPTTFLNGWGGNAHVGAYELGVNQGFNWGLDPGTTNGYTNPSLAFDGNLATKASAVFQHTHQYAGCVWQFAAIAPSGFARTLNINSMVPPNGSGGVIVTLRSAGIWYSLDAGTTWIQVYNVASRLQQWDSIPLPVSQDLSKVQVMAFLDSHDDMAHYVFEINISEAQSPQLGFNAGIYQLDDYLHFSINLDKPQNLTELKLQLDVGDGSFTQNYFYYSVRASDIVAASGNSATQLAVAQLIMQKGRVFGDAMDAALAISGVVVAGGGQWSEIWLSLRELTRVGGDQTRTLANISNVQILVNATAPIIVSVSSIAFVGGGQPDVGDVGAPYLYRVRPRDSSTGVLGNPSPETRYGVAARRQGVQVFLPSAAYDPQIDTWDIERYGGAITSWRQIGQTPSTNTVFLDNYDDAAAQAGDALDFDNFEPWPSIDLPFSFNALQVIGTSALVSVPSPTNILSFLPGNLVQIGGRNVYTLRKRPTLVSGTTYLLDFEECAGVGMTPTLVIQEPEIANRPLPYMWGPDVNGTVFACGDTLRPGTLYFSKSNAPDSAPDTFNLEICSPSEPLLGGEVVDGLSFVWSTERCWALYPTPDNPVQRYNFVQQPFPRGIAAPFGHCTDGVALYWYAKDGIYSSAQGSLTDEDLYNIFPHEGVVAENYVYNGVTITPPYYAYANQFRLSQSNGYLYATYVDATAIHRMLVYDIKRKTWTVDQYPSEISAVYHVEQQSKSGPDTSTPALNPVTLLAGRTGATQGTVFQQATGTNDGNTPIQCTVAVREFDGGDVRAPAQWGDIFLDLVPNANLGVIVTPMSLGAGIAAPTTIPKSASRQRDSISVGGIVISDFMGLFLQWSDDFANQPAATQLFTWQPSYDIQPAKSIGWSTFGTSFGMKGYGHIPQISLAWLSTAPITLTITTFDGQPPQVLTIPSSGGLYKKQLFRLSANKGLLFVFAAASTQQFQIFEDDCDIYVGEWGREGSYGTFKSFGGVQSSTSPI